MCPLWLKGGPRGSIPEPHQGEGVLWAEGAGAPASPGLPRIVRAASSRSPESGHLKCCPLWPGAFLEAGGNQERGWRAARLPETLLTPCSTSRALWWRRAACFHPWIHQQDPGPRALPPGPSSSPGAPETLARSRCSQHGALAGAAAQPPSHPRPAASVSHSGISMRENTCSGKKKW